MLTTEGFSLFGSCTIRMNRGRKTGTLARNAERDDIEEEEEEKEEVSDDDEEFSIRFWLKFVGAKILTVYKYSIADVSNNNRDGRRGSRRFTLSLSCT